MTGDDETPTNDPTKRPLDPFEHPTYEPLRPLGASSQAPSWSATPTPAADAVATPAYRAGETITPRTATTSSRLGRDRSLAGVVAVSLLCATIASAATAGLLASTAGSRAAPAASTGTNGTGTTAATSSSGTTPVTIDSNQAVVDVAAHASPAVVTITTESVGNGQQFGPGSMPSTGIGSGFVFDASGLILTNHHVIEGGTTLTVTFQDGTETTGTVVADDPTHDLAVVKVDKTGLPTIAIGDSSKLKVGQLVVAIGSPLGTFTETVTSGILSATDRTIDVGSAGSRQTTSMSGLLQTDAAINEGNSGGPLLDSTGQVIGVNVAVAASAQGIGFAIPIQVAATIMAQARAKA
jgi:S1-C subfamily serine protease